MEGTFPDHEKTFRSVPHTLGAFCNRAQVPVYKEILIRFLGGNNRKFLFIKRIAEGGKFIFPQNATFPKCIDEADSITNELNECRRNGK